MTTSETAATWQPHVSVNLDDLKSPFVFTEMVEQFHKWSDEQPPVEPHGLVDGWQTITPQIAENILRRNPPGINRKPALSTIHYYARQMKAGEWKRTGQPIILSDKGDLLDGQHRAWAGYLSNRAFDNYVVTEVPHFENIFAYIDNGKPRSAKDALFTAGINGLSAVISQAVALGRLYDANALAVMKNKHVDRPTPVEVLAYAASNPLLAKAAHVQIGEYKAATKLIGYPDIAVFAAWKILEGFSEDSLDHFMSDLGSSEPLADGDPILLLRKKLVENSASTDPMPKRHALGYVTKVFNAWRLKQPMRRLFLKTDEVWPRFADTSVETEIAA
jgi:hypothetical protein